MCLPQAGSLSEKTGNSVLNTLLSTALSPLFQPGLEFHTAAETASSSIPASLHAWPHPHHSNCSGGVPVTVCGEGLAEGDSLNTPVFKVPPDLVGNGLGVLLPFSILAPCCPSTRRNIISGVLVPWGKESKHIRAGQGTARRAQSFLKHAHRAVPAFIPSDCGSC